MIFSLSFCSLQTVTCKPKDWKFKRLIREDGLASNKVNCIHEDKLGFIWFGTQNGLCKYNGYDFEIFKNNPKDEFSICDNRVVSIIQDSVGDNLWIGTEEGLCYFNLEEQKFYRYKSNPNINSNRFIHSLFIDNKNKLWIGTGLGLNYLGKDSTYVLYNNYKDSHKNAVYTIKQDCKQRLWVGSSMGLFTISKDGKRLKKYNKTPNLYEVRSLYCDSLDNLWVCSDRVGMFLLKNGDINSTMKKFSKESGHLINNRGYGFVEVADDKLLIADRDGGLVLFNTKTHKSKFILPDLFDQYSISSKAVITICKTSNNIVWVGTFNTGVCYLDKKLKKFEHYTLNFKCDGLFSSNIRSVFEDAEEKIWIGTKENGGLSQFHREEGTFTHFKPDDKDDKSLSDDYIFSISEIDKDNLLVGTFQYGLDVLNKKTGLFKNIRANDKNPKGLTSNHIYSLFKDKENLIWVGTYDVMSAYGIVNIYHPKTGEFSKIKGIINARCFLDEDSSKIWIGTYMDGLYLYDKISGNYEHYFYKKNDSLSITDNEITALIKDQDNKVWIGTSEGGVCVYRKGEGIYKSYKVKDGLPSNRVLGILVDDRNNIWISTANGLSMFNQKLKKFRNYNVQDGLQGNEFEKYVALKTRNGEMLFGGRNGFNIFHPNNIKDNKFIPDVFITGLKLANKDVPIGGENSPLKKHITKAKQIILSHDQSSIITLKFVALNYTDSEKNEYAYMMENFDDKWIYCGNKREVTYTNLNPGKYEFKVKASNNDGYWNEKGTSLKIIVLPPWYKTRLFIVFVIILIIGSSLALYFRRVSRLMLQKKQLETIVANRTSDLKKSNQELAKHKDHLEEIVENRTKELLIAKNRAEESDRLKSAFLANMSHEIRTPMNAIIGFTTLLEEPDITEEERLEYRKIIKSNGESLLVLIDDLMNTSLIESNQVEIKKTIFDIHELFYEFENYAMLSNAENIYISFETKNLYKTVELYCDRQRIQQIVTNLLNNAIKYTHQGYVKFGYTIENNVLKIYVKDTGIGIDKKYQDKVFNQFYKVEGDKKRIYGGSGIGLYMCKRLVGLLGGEINIESELNKGTIVFVNIPCENIKIEI